MHILSYEFPYFQKEFKMSFRLMRNSCVTFFYTDFMGGIEKKLVLF